MADKVTRWFDGRTKPVRPGVYQTTASLYGSYQYWNGKHWCAYAFDPETAYSYRDTRSNHQLEQWRGLTNPSSK